MSIPDPLRQRLASYTPPQEGVSLLQSSQVVLLVGISAAGKDTIKHQLLERYPSQYHHIISHTTRAPRENKGVMETDGVDYHFISPDAAMRMLDERAFIEAKEYSGNLYGTSVAEFAAALSEHRVAITDLEVQGVAEYVRLSPLVRPIFILPPSYQTWQRRMMQRYGSAEEGGADNVQRRIATAKTELQHAAEAPYFHFVINDDLTACVDQIHQLATAPTFTPEASLQAKKVIDGIISQL